MKFLLTTYLLSSLFSTFANANVRCGNSLDIDAEMLTDINKPECIGYKENLASPTGKVNQAWIAGSDKENKLMIQVIEWKTGTSQAQAADEMVRVAVLEMSTTQQGTIPFYAFRNSCGLALMTAKIIDREKTLLVFDNLTVVKVSPVVMFPEVSLLHTKFDPYSGYTCAGLNRSLNAYDNLITINEGSRTISVKSRGNGASSKPISY